MTFVNLSSLCVVILKKGANKKNYRWQFAGDLQQKKTLEFTEKEKDISI